MRSYIIACWRCGRSVVGATPGDTCGGCGEVVVDEMADAEEVSR